MRYPKACLTALLALLMLLTACAAPAPQGVQAPAQSETQPPAAAQAPAQSEASAQSEAQAPAEAETPAQSAQPAQAVDVSTLPALDSGYYDEFFDGGLFIGDSITQGLQNYMVQKRKDQPRLLGDAKFVTAKSFSLEAACSDVVTDGEAALRYRGRAMTVPELLASTEAKALFILLGTNDCAGKSPADVIAPYKTLLSLVKASAPDIRLYVQSCTPIVAARETAQLSNATLDALNAELKTLAQQSGAGFIDVATALKNGGAGMEPAFSSDQYVHINEAGAQAWIDALYTYAREACAAGAWAPIAALEETAGEAPAA